MYLLNEWCPIAGVAGVAVLVIVIVTLLCCKSRRKCTLSSDYSKWRTATFPKDTVLLHQLGRGPYAPSLSPFAVKLETYLRMAKIPYENVYGNLEGPKEKIPWIEYNGDIIPDTEFVIEFLNRTIGVDLNKHLGPEFKGIARIVERMVDEHVYWTSVLYRWVLDKEHKTLKAAGISKSFMAMINKKFTDICYGQGVGRYSMDELGHIIKTDLEALSSFLGTKSYMMGMIPTEVDCAVFGQLSQIRWQLEGSIAEEILQGYCNLNEYCDRMKNRYWPDWDDCTTSGGTKTAAN